MTKRDAAEAWWDSQPTLYAAFKKYAKEAASKRREFTVAVLTGRVRWAILLDSGAAVKVGGEFAACVARRLLIDLPELRPYLLFRDTDAPCKREAFS